MNTVSIDYSNIKERCKMLSAFEGKALVNGSGESMHKDIRLTDLEDALMENYIKQGEDIAEATLGNGVAITATTVTMYSGTETERVGNGKVGRSLEEALAAYVMYMWLENKVADRSASYKTIFTDMLEAVKKMVYRKKEPDWDNN